MDSIKLAARCYNQGLLSKEAMQEVLRTRERLIKEAISLRMGTRFAGKGAPSTGGFMDKLKSGLGIASVEKAGRGGDSPLEWPQAVANLVKLLGAGAALQGGSTAVSGLVRHHKDKELKGQIQESYKKMMEERPQLKEMDRDKISRNFGVLARYAPSLAADPTVAGSWVQSSTSMDYVDPQAIRQLSDTQNAIDRAHEERSLIPPGQFSKNIAMATTALG